MVVKKKTHVLASAVSWRKDSRWHVMAPLGERRALPHTTWLKLIKPSAPPTPGAFHMVSHEVRILKKGRRGRRERAQGCARVRKHRCVSVPGFSEEASPGVEMGHQGMCGQSQGWRWATKECTVNPRRCGDGKGLGRKEKNSATSPVKIGKEGDATH